MTGILADADIQGHFTVLLRLFRDVSRSEIWNSLELSTPRFEDLGLTADASDRQIWQQCQRRQLVLLTANRNDEGPDSLESVLRTENQPECLPVFTLANPKRFLRDRESAGRVADRLLEYLFDIEVHRGASRLFLP